MADIQLKADKVELEKLRKLFGEFYDEDNKKKTIYKAPDNDYPTVEKYVDHLYEIGMPKGTPVRRMELILEQNYENLTKSPEYSESTTTGAQEQTDTNSVSVSTGSLEQFEKEKEARSAVKVQADLKAKQDVEASIKKQLEIHAQEVQKAKAAEVRLKAENKKIYYKAEAQEKAFLTTKQMQALETLKQQANTAPEETFKQIKESIQNKVQNIPEGAADKAAYDILENLRSDSEAAAKDAVLQEMSAKAELFDKEQELLAWTKELSTEKANRIALDQKLAEATFGKEFASNIVPKYKVQFSETSEPGFNKSISLEEIPQQRISALNDQSSFLQSLGGDFVKSKVEARAYSFIGEKTEQQVLGMIAKGTISEGTGGLVKTALSVFGATAPMEWVVIEGSVVGEFAMATGMGPTFGFLGELTGSDVFGVVGGAAGGAAGTIIGTTTTAAAGSVATTFTFGSGAAVISGVTTGVTTTAVAGTTAAATAAAGAAAGSVVPIAGTIVGWVGGLIVGLGLGKIAEKIPWDKIKGFLNNFKEFFFFGGIATMFLVPGAAGLFIGGTSAIIGGASGLATGGFSLTGALTGFGQVIGAIGGATMGAIGKPILATFLIFPLVVALILFIINSGAYVVPPGAQQISSTNAYISVEKTSSVSGKATSPTSVTYTITINAKKDTLTGITISNDCKATKKGGSPIDCKDLEKMPASADIPIQITPGSPFTFTFTSNYDSKYQDSLVADNVNVSATSTSGGKVSEIGSASVCFGNCPLDCFAFPDNYWPQNPDVQKLKSLLTGAIGTLAGQYPNFAAKVCAGGTVNLCYKPSILPPNIFAWHEHNSCDIDFGSQVTPYGPEGVLFLLTHEVTHHIQDINKGSFTKFMDQVNPPQSEGYICTRGADNPYESMAEASALFVAKPTIDAAGSCLTRSFQSQYPKHYNFAKNVMFAP